MIQSGKMNSDLKQKEKKLVVKLFNRFTIGLALFFSFITIWFHLLHGLNGATLITLGSAIGLLFSSVILSYYRLHDISKFITIIVPPYAFMLASIFIKSDEIYNNYFTYLAARVFVILYILVPVFFFSLEKLKQLIVSIVLLSPAILFFDYFNNLAGIRLEDLKYEAGFYSVFVTIFAVSYSFAIFGLLLSQRFNISFRGRIQTQNLEIIKEKQEVQELNSQLQFQSNLYSILNITSKNRNLMFTLQDVLDQILTLDGLSAKNRGLIYIKNNKNEFEIAAHKNVDSLIESFSILNEIDAVFDARLTSTKFDDTNKPPHDQYRVPIMNKKDTLGVINICINEGEKFSKSTQEFLENIAIILSRKILEDQNKEKLNLKNIEFKNQEITLKHTLAELNQSIAYAQFLQKSLIPNQDTMNQYFEDSGFLFKPRDQVSGDFYFAHEVEDNLYFGVADCTGHGIPGAFLAAMSIEAVKTVILTNKNKKPDEILTKLREIGKDRFSTNLNDNRSDAMDAAICMYGKKDNKLYYSGGFINLLIVRNNSDIIITPATKSPIGSYPIEQEFELHEIKLEKGDVIYLSSDGYVDQFGQDKNSIKNRPSKFKHKRFRELLIQISHLPSDEQVKILKTKLVEWRGKTEQTDDVTVFIAKH